MSQPATRAAISEASPMDLLPVDSAPWRLFDEARGTEEALRGGRIRVLARLWYQKQMWDALRTILALR